MKKRFKRFKNLKRGVFKSMEQGINSEQGLSVEQQQEDEDLQYTFSSFYLKIVMFFLLVLTLFALTFFFLNKDKFSFSNIDSSTMAAITFIYGFFISILFSFIIRKYHYVKNAFIKINACLIGIYQLALSTKDKEFIASVKQNIKTFLKRLEPLEFFSKEFLETQKQVYPFYKSLQVLKKVDGKKSQYLSRIIQLINNLVQAREELETYSRKYLVGILNFLFILVNVLIIGVFMVRVLTTTNAFDFIIAVGVIIVALTTLIFFYDLDDLSYGEYSLKYFNFKQLEEMLGEE